MADTKRADLYDRSEQIPDPLALDKEGIATARLADVLDIGPRILSVALVIAATVFFLANLDAFAGVGALLALLGAAIVLGWGVLLSSAALMHRHLWKLSPTSRHDYALRLYHGRSGKNPKKACELLLGMARADIETGKIEAAAAALSHADSALLEGDELKLFYLLSYVTAIPEGGKNAEEALVRYAAVPVKRFAGFPDEKEAASWLDYADVDKARAVVAGIRGPKRLHPALQLALSLMAAHVLAYCGMLYGVDADAGWMLRCGYASVAGLLAVASLVVLGIAIARVARKTPLQSANGKGARLARGILALFIVLAALSLGAQLLIDGPLMHDGEERAVAQGVPDQFADKVYDYLAVAWSGYDPRDTTTDYWRTNSPFLMEKWSEAALYDTESPAPENDSSSSAGGDASGSGEDTASGTNDTAADGSSQDASGNEAEAQLEATKDRMRSLAVYLEDNGIVPDMDVFDAILFDENAKGDMYARLGTASDKENGKLVTVEYRLYSNGEKTDGQGLTSEEFVLEKWYPQDEGRDAEVLGFYLVDEASGAVTDEEKTSW